MSTPSQTLAAMLERFNILHMFQTEAPFNTFIELANAPLPLDPVERSMADQDLANAAQAVMDAGFPSDIDAFKWAVDQVYPTIYWEERRAFTSILMYNNLVRRDFARPPAKRQRT